MMGESQSWVSVRKGDEAYFSWANLAQLSSLDSHIAYARELIGRYEWPSQVRWDLNTRLQAIVRKQQDINLNMSVIGEFSSGKSSFINALLRQDLLAADVLQGTTVASTVIGYSPEYSIAWREQRQAAQRLTFPSVVPFRQILNQMAANNDSAQGLEEVEVGLPAENLREGKFRIIDTPGLNATVQWHEQVTIRTLRETSDISIILVDALRPLPQDLCDFISDHLESVLDQCIFVVTKFDLLPPKERKMMLKYVERTVKNRFGLEKPLVLPYSSADVLNSVIPGFFPPGKYPAEPEVSLATETHILEHMARQRAVAQARKLLSLTGLIYESIGKQMEDLNAHYTQRLELLEQTRQADLTGFVAEQKTVCAQRYAEKAAIARGLPREAFISACSVARGEMLRLIEAQDSTDHLNQYMKDRFKTDCVEQGKELCKKLVRKVEREQHYSIAADRILQDFGKLFREKFRNLDCLAPDPKTLEITPPQIALPTVRAIDNAEAYTGEMVRKENAMAGKGLLAGAAMGTAIAPGIGTVLGGAIGFARGLARANKTGINVQEMRQHLIKTLWHPLQEYFTEIADAVYTAVDAYSAAIGQQIDLEIDRYLETYRTTVEEWIREEQEKRAQLERKLYQLEEDRRQLELRREAVESIRSRIQPNQEEEE